jgi:hypothetical protein
MHYYMGLVAHRGESRAGGHAAILTEHEWLAAQQPRRPLVRSSLPPLLLQGVASCRSCGHRLYALQPKKRWGPDAGGRYAYYIEPSDDFNRDCPDGGVIWPSEAPDRQIDELMRSFTLSREWLDFVIAEAAKLPLNVEVRRHQLQDSIRRMQKEYLARRLDEAEYLSLRSEHEGELSLLPLVRHDLVVAARQMEAFGEMWDSASPRARNEACRLVFESVVLDMRARTVVEVKPYPEFEPLFRLRRSVYVTQTVPGPNTPNVNGARRAGLYTLEELGVVA